MNATIFIFQILWVEPGWCNNSGGGAGGAGRAGAQCYVLELGFVQVLRIV